MSLTTQQMDFILILFIIIIIFVVIKGWYIFSKYFEFLTVQRSQSKRESQASDIVANFSSIPPYLALLKSEVEAVLL